MSKPDYLNIDTAIPGQEWIVLSILDGKQLKNCNYDFSIMKFRGAFSSSDEANKHALYLQSIDPTCNIYVAPGFTWIPVIDDPEKAKDTKYADQNMNNLMEKYLMNQAKAKELYERRKNEMVMESINKKNKKNKKSKKAVSIDDLESNDKLASQVNTDANTDNNDEIPEIDDSKTLQQILEESNAKTAALEAEIARAKQMLNMDIDGFTNAKKAHDDIDNKLEKASKEN